MNSTDKIKIVFVATAFLLCGGATHAQHRHWRPRVHRMVRIVPRPVLTVTQPVVTMHVSNRFSQKERLELALAYLATHEHLTIKQYAKMTSLSKAVAEAELDAFAANKSRPISVVIKGKKKLYIKIA